MIRLSVKIATNSVWLALRIKGLSKKKVERVVIKKVRMFSDSRPPEGCLSAIDLQQRFVHFFCMSGYIWVRLGTSG